MLFDLSSVIHATPGLEELSAPFTKRPVWSLIIFLQ
jgi:hypothetical protein